MIALAIWNKVAVPSEEAPLHPTATAKVYEAADAPVSQLNLGKAGDAAALGIAAAGPGTGAARPVVSLDSSPNAAAAANPKSAAAAAALRGARNARAPGRPFDAGTEPSPTDRTRPAMTEEERSARNEQMFGELEKQKKILGMKVLPKSETRPDPGVAAMLGLPQAAPVSPIVRGASPTLLKTSSADGPAAESAPEAPASAGLGRLSQDAGLVFADAGSLASSWVLLGLPGSPPATDFARGRLVIIKPSAAKILLVTPGRDAVAVVYRPLEPGEEADPARDRVAPLPAEPKTVLIYDASPR